MVPVSGADQYYNVVERLYLIYIAVLISVNAIHRKYVRRRSDRLLHDSVANHVTCDPWKQARG